MAFLVAANMVCPAEEPIAVDKVFSVIHEQPHATTRDPLLFVRRNIGTREHSTASFSLRADYTRFRHEDQFCDRRETGILGLKAVFSF